LKLFEPLFVVGAALLSVQLSQRFQRQALIAQRRGLKSVLELVAKAQAMQQHGALFLCRQIGGSRGASEFGSIHPHIFSRTLSVSQVSIVMRCFLAHGKKVILTFVLFQVELTPYL
jgi:hypothetical protein